MSKFKPEKRHDLERRIKEFDSKIKDSTNHMSKVVKNDAKAIADLSKKIKPGGTIEGAKAINESSQQAGKEVKKKYDQLGKTVENLVKKGGNLESEFDEREKYSKLNYAELTKASSSIEETPAARDKINQGRRVAQENIQTMGLLCDTVHRAMQRTGQRIKELDYKIGGMLPFFGSDGKTEKKTGKANAVKEGLGATKGSSRKEASKKYREANREKILEQKRKYREANKDKVAGYKKKWNESNRKEMRLLGLLNKERFDENGEIKRRDNEANREEIRLSKLLKKERLKKSRVAWKYYTELEKRKYREAKREKIAEGVKMFHEANREKIAAIQKKHREANKDKLSEEQKKRYEANKEKWERGKSIALPVFAGDGKHQVNIDNEIAEEVKKILPEIKNKVLQDCMENPGKFLTDDAEYLEVINERFPEMPNEVLQDCIEHLRMSSDDEIDMNRCKSEPYNSIYERDSSEERNDRYKS